MAPGKDSLDAEPGLARPQDSMLDEVSALVGRITRQYLENRLAAVGLKETPEMLRREERLLVDQREQIESRLAEVRRKLELSASILTEVEQFVRQVTAEMGERLTPGAPPSSPHRGPEFADYVGRGAWPDGIWHRAELVYLDGHSVRPSYLPHQSPMAKLGEACGCYTETWRQLASPYFGKDATLVVPAQMRLKPTARNRGESVTVRLSEWGPLPRP